ncbi:MAG: terminase family protein [Candidatus Methanomethylicaceae archaeon]
MAILSTTDRIVFQNAMHPRTGGLIVLTRHFFGWEPFPYQFAFHHASQPNVTLLAGIGAGKTEAAAFSEVADCLLTPYFQILHTSISTYQAELALEKLEPHLRDNKKIMAYIKDIEKRPYPTIRFKNGSFITYRTVGYEARLIRGGEFDRIVFDEAGYESSYQTLVALRGRLRGRRPDGTPRGMRPGCEFLGPRLDVITTPTDVEWLATRWRRGLRGEDDADLSRYISIRATTFDNKSLTKEQIDNMISDYTEEMIRREIMAELPNYGDGEFPHVFIDACEDRVMNDEMEIAVYGDRENGTPPRPGYSYRENRFGCIYWETPAYPDRIYIMAGDPGTDAPPRRNSPVVMVFDVTTRPYTMVYFDWISGNGSYLPFIQSYKYAMEKYRPIYAGIDATSTQRAIDELAFEQFGIRTDAINFSRDKDAMVNSLKFALTNRDLRFPFIKGLREQLRNYRRGEDKKLPQDIVATLMQITYLARNVESPRVETRVKVDVMDSRSIRAIFRSRGRFGRARKRL